MSFHLHRDDEAGRYCQGSYATAGEARHDALNTIKVRKKVGEKWKEITPPAGFEFAWKNGKGHMIGVKST